VWHIAGREQLSRLRIGEIVQKKLNDKKMEKMIEMGRVNSIPTPDGLPLNRTLCIEKFVREFPDLKIPNFGDCADELISRMKIAEYQRT